MECWGNNTEAYCRAFGSEDRHAASASAARLARDPQVRARSVWLRERSVEEMGVDRAWILAKRKYMAEHTRNAADRLRAIESMEKSLGLDMPVMGTEKQGRAWRMADRLPEICGRLWNAALIQALVGD